MAQVILTPKSIVLNIFPLFSISQLVYSRQAKILWSLKSLEPEIQGERRSSNTFNKKIENYEDKIQHKASKRCV